MTYSRKAADLIRFSIRVEPSVKAAIDELRESRAGSISTNTWIAEAIQEKLVRETKKETTPNA